MTPQEKNQFKIIYIHGFGGKNNYPNQIRGITKLLETYQMPPQTVYVHPWDSEVITSLFKIPNHWEKAKEKLGQESKILKEKILEIDRSGDPIYIIAFSLGTRLLLDTLSNLEAPLNNLAHIFLLGGATSNDYELDHIKIKNHTKIINYHSNKRDFALKAFAAREDRDAIGYSGFSKNYTYLKQFNVNRSHLSLSANEISSTINENSLLKLIYNTMSYPSQEIIAPSYNTFTDCIMEMIAYLEKWRYPSTLTSKTPNKNYVLKTKTGHVFWDTIYSTNHGNDEYEIQKNIVFKHYRLIKNNISVQSDWTCLQNILEFCTRQYGINILGELSTKT
jgi:hypothetical protein